MPPMKRQLLALFGVTVIATSVTDCANAAEPADKGNAPAKTIAASTNVLIFRNIRSWNRKPDFEEALTELGFKYDVKLSAEMGATDLSSYAFVIIPGAQWKDDYYHQYAEHVA